MNMLNIISKTKKPKASTMEKILHEVILLRQELKFVLPQDNLSDYKNAVKIKKTYKNALKAYPPLCK